MDGSVSNPAVAARAQVEALEQVAAEAAASASAFKSVSSVIDAD